MTFYKPIMYGFLPIDRIAHILKEELRDGRVRLSALAHMAEAIENPTYIGKPPWQIRNFELVKKIEDHNLLTRS